MTADRGNRGEEVRGVKYATIDPIADQLAFDRLPASLRRYLIGVPFRLSAAQIERLLDDGQDESAIIAHCERSLARFLAKAEAEKQSGARL